MEGGAPHLAVRALFIAGYMTAKTGVPRAKGFPRVWGGGIKSVPDLSNSCLFPHTHLYLHSHWIPSWRLHQSSLDTKFTDTSSSGSVRRAITYLSLDLGDFNFSSRKHHPHRKQYPIPFALWLYT